MLVTLNEAKQYLRVDSSDEDNLISSILASTEKLCMDVARLTADEWNAIAAVTSDSDESGSDAAGEGNSETEDSGLDASGEEDAKTEGTNTEEADSEDTTITIRSEEVSSEEAMRMKEILRIGVMYSLGYLFEHREEADHHSLMLTLRNILFSIREGVF